jgi:hypothetical protein
LYCTVHGLSRARKITPTEDATGLRSESVRNESSGDDTDVVMRRLTRLVANPMDVVIQMLLTCRGQALDFQQYFQEDEILGTDEDTDIDELAIGKIRHIRGSE